MLPFFFALLMGCATGKHAAGSAKNKASSAKKNKSPVIIQQPKSVDCNKAVQATVRLQSQGIGKCYAKLLVHQPRLRGRLGLHLMIAEEGWVKRAKVTTNTTNDRVLAQCVRKFGRTLSFPKGCSGSVTFHFNLDPSKAVRKIQRK